MLYYSFTCENCGDNRVFDDTTVINHLISQGYHQCGICDHRTEIDPNKVVKDDQPEPSSYYPEPGKYKGYDGQDLPKPLDMQVYYEDLENIEDWQRLILDEFESSDDLTRDDKYGYEDALIQLKSHQFGWVKFAVWAFQFKLKRFYKRHYKTWKQFCEKVLHLGHDYVDKKIKAARVIRDLICAGFTVLPQNEYQCRFLTKFWGDELIENWAMIVDGVPPHLITGNLLKASFCSREPREEKWVKIDSKLWEEFEYKAHSLHTITDVQIVNGLLEIVETDGNIIRCNSSETKEILENSVPFVKRALLGKNPIPGSNIDYPFDED